MGFKIAAQISAVHIGACKQAIDLGEIGVPEAARSRIGKGGGHWEAPGSRLSTDAASFDHAGIMAFRSSRPRVVRA